MKNLLLFVVFLSFLSCTDGNKGNRRFTEQQIKQLDLPHVKPLKINKESITLDLNPYLKEKELLINELLKEVQYIPLETTHESLIVEINKLLCTEEHFFVLDSDIGENVFIFSSEGKFIKKIPTGQGPEEIYKPEDIAIDETSEQLIIYSKRSLFFFDFQGNFIKRMPLPFFIDNFKVTPEGYVFKIGNADNRHLQTIENEQLLITDKNFRIISAGISIHYSKENIYGIHDYTNSFENNIYVSSKFSEKIYQYVDTVSVKELFTLDFSSKKYPNSYLEMSMEEILGNLKKNDYFYFMGDFVENKTHFFLVLNNNYRKGKYKTLIFINKANNQLQGGNTIKLSDEFPLFGYPLVGYKDYFIGQVSSKNVEFYLSQTKKEDKKPIKLLSDIKNDDNPVLIRYKLTENQ